MIGDQQTVEGDLSSFSAHLVALDAIVRDADARSSDGEGGQTLVLLDELANGTDPTQGAAIGQAILERLVDVGCRVIVTTHYGPLKRLASFDQRFSVAAMQYLDGRPTYRVLAGIAGESHAFGIAQRIGLDPALISRATSLMGEGERSVAVTLEELESERSRYQQAADDAERLRAELVQRTALVAEKEIEIANKARKLEFDEARVFLQRVRQAEKAIAEIVDKLREDPSEREAELAKKSVSAFRGIVPAKPAPAPEVPAAEYAVGDQVRLREYDLVGEVLAVGDGGLLVRTGAVTINTRPDQVERARGRLHKGAR